MYTCHLFGCAWFYIGTLGQPAGQANPDGWLVAAGINTTHGPDMTPITEQYITSYYWGITVLSTVGFGDITPQTWEEKLFAILAELFGCMVFAMMIGGLSGIFSASKLQQRVTDEMDEIQEWALRHAKMGSTRAKLIVGAVEEIIASEVYAGIEAHVEHRLRTHSESVDFGTNLERAGRAKKALSKLEELQQQELQQGDHERQESRLPPDTMEVMPTAVRLTEIENNIQSLTKQMENQAANMAELKTLILGLRSSR